jgi:hypothetical protein
LTVSEKWLRRGQKGNRQRASSEPAVQATKSTKHRLTRTAGVRQIDQKYQKYLGKKTHFHIMLPKADRRKHEAAG